VSSTRYRKQVSGWSSISSDPPAGDPRGGDYRLPRDPAVDHTTPQGFETVGLAGDPFPPVVLGSQTSHKSHATPAGRPGFWRLIPFRPQERSLDRLQGTTVAPGTIRRNVQYSKNGIPAPGLFSWAANLITYALGFEPARPPQDEYLVSSHHLMLADSLATVVSGTTKTAPGLEPFRGGATVQAGPSTGWPVVAPQIPSYGSRVPLRRPRGLVSVDA
jgi:hypothetical protein